MDRQHGSLFFAQRQDVGLEQQRSQLGCVAG